MIEACWPFDGYDDRSSPARSMASHQDARLELFMPTAHCHFIKATSCPPFELTSTPVTYRIQRARMSFSPTTRHGQRRQISERRSASFALLGENEETDDGGYRAWMSLTTEDLNTR